jgi:aspartyl-tRNA(Asn)/glutamyl-tRNA(Gln) amidotransferase subunit A
MSTASSRQRHSMRDGGEILVQPYEMTISDASSSIAAGQLSPTELFDSVVGQLERVEPHVAAFDVLTLEFAHREAIAATGVAMNGERHNPLLGIPIGIKSLIDRAQVECTSSSATRQGRIAQQDAAVVARLRQAGAVLVGQTHTHEYAYGSVTPTTHNPWSLDRIVGGSSGGSAAAVASGMALAAIGTDTAGSIRVPAALCGVTGLKPTYGRVSCSGVTPLSWSLDHVGPLTRTATDAAIVLQGIEEAAWAQQTPAPSTSIPAELGAEDLSGITIGVPDNYFFDNLNPEVEAAVRAAVDVLTELGAVAKPITIPHADLYSPVGHTILMAEASAWHRKQLRTSGHLYTPDVRIMLEAGELLRAVDYVNAQRARALLQQAWRGVLAEVDVVVAPTVPAAAAMADQVAFNWSDGSVEPLAEAYVRFTAPSNLTGLPAVSLPCGWGSDQMPIGLQIIGRPFDERTILHIGERYQAVTPWLRSPAECVRPGPLPDRLAVR